MLFLIILINLALKKFDRAANLLALREIEESFAKAPNDDVRHRMFEERREDITSRARNEILCATLATPVSKDTGTAFLPQWLLHEEFLRSHRSEIATCVGRFIKMAYYRIPPDEVLRTMHTSIDFNAEIPASLTLIRKPEGSFDERAPRPGR